MFYMNNESRSKPQLYLQQSQEEFKMVLVNPPKQNAHHSSVKRSNNRIRKKNLLYDTFKPKATSTPCRFKPVLGSATEFTTNCFKPLTVSQFVGNNPQTYQHLKEIDGFSAYSSAESVKEVAVKLQNFIGQTSKSFETIFLDDSVDKRSQALFVPRKCFSYAKGKNVNHVQTMTKEQRKDLTKKSCTIASTLDSTINSTSNDLKLIFQTKKSVNQCDLAKKYGLSDKRSLNNTFLSFEKYLEHKMSKLLNNNLSPHLIQSFIKDKNGTQSYCTTLPAQPPICDSFKLSVRDHIKKVNILNGSIELDMDKICLWNESKNKEGMLIDVHEFWKQDEELYLLVDYLECN